MVSERDEGPDDGPEDAHLFRQAVADAKPHVDPRADTGARPPRPEPHQSRADDDAVLASLLEIAPEQLEAETGEELLFCRAGVRRQVFKRLRRGQYPTRADLDLHGLTRREAYPLVTQFIREQREAGSRCVRIVHGKGRGSAHRGAVLKGAVDDWLRCFDEVLAFASARPRDGGTGAVYVLLRGPRR